MKRFGQILRELWRDPMGRIGIVGIFLAHSDGDFCSPASPFGPTPSADALKAPPSSEHSVRHGQITGATFSAVSCTAPASRWRLAYRRGHRAFFRLSPRSDSPDISRARSTASSCASWISFSPFPSILLAIFHLRSAGQGLGPTMIAIGIVNIPVFCPHGPRRGHLRQGTGIRQERPASASKLALCSIRHISPNVVAPFTVQATLALSSAILTEATLSFLGLGIQPPNPSWGSMLSEARDRHGTAPPGWRFSRSLHHRHDPALQYPGRLAPRRAGPEAKV